MGKDAEVSSLPDPFLGQSQSEATQGTGYERTS